MMRGLLILIVGIIGAAPATAAIVVPGASGADGALNVASNTVIDLSLAPSGAWDATPPVPGKGIYDPEKWAVVFKYSSVNVAANTTLTFKNNLSFAPVVWLVNGDVTISGAVSLNGSLYGSTFSEPGPGGFHGGRAGMGGLGPGGANLSTTAAASYGTKGAGGGAGAGDPYGNPQLTPLMGGSGGSNRGSGGGGAILIAATGTITINGSITANAQRGWYVGNDGSGGAIRLVADAITGNGSLRALGTSNSGKGRIRLEPGTTASPLLSIDPPPSASHPTSPVSLWPGVGASSVRIVSVGGEAVPSDIRSQFDAAADVFPDIVAATIPVVIETANVPTSAVVNLRAAPFTGAPVVVRATFVGGTEALARWKADIAPIPGTTALVARVESAGS